MGQDVLNEIAWRDFVTFAWSRPDAHAAFRGATGRPQRRETGFFLDAAIDRACGVDIDSEAYMREFVDWVTKNHWGENYAPEKWKKLRGVNGQITTEDKR
jgi:hypothetical protein